jgi:hypothetical protein
MKNQIAFFIFLILFLGCQPKVGKKDKLPSVPVLKTPQVAVLQVESENVRLTPNGEKIGQLLMGDSLNIIKRQGNWLYFYNDFFDSSYIWAPSAGIDYINIYNPLSYFDPIAGQFYPVSYFRSLFGNPGEQKNPSSGKSEIFFGKLGLGSHEDLVIEVVNAQTVTNTHGITLFTDRPENSIYKIKIDFFKPIKGMDNALEKCGLYTAPPDLQNGGHVFWNAGTIIPNLRIDLERREWESEWFSGLWIEKIKDQR